MGVTVNYGLSAHFPVLSTFLRVLQSYKFVQNLDEAVCTGDFQSLMEITKVNDFELIMSLKTATNSVRKLPTLY